MTEGNYKLNLRSDWEDRSRSISTHSFVMSLFMVVNILIHTMIFATAWSIQSEFGIFGGTTLLLLFIFALLTTILTKTYNGFQVGLRTVEDLVFSQGLALLFSSTGVFLVQVLLIKGIPNLWITLATLIANVGWSVIWCLLANRLYNRLFPALKTAIVYEYREALESVEGLYSQEKRFNVIRTIHVSENVNDILPQLTDVEAVFICGMPAHKRNVILKHCVEQGVRAYVRPKISDVILSSAEKMQMFHVPMLMCRRRTMPLSYRAAKRIIDVVLAGLAFIITSLFMLIIAADNSFLESGRPCNDPLWHVEEDDKQKLKKKLGIPLDKKVILYAPTWRESTNGGKSYDIKPPIDLNVWEEKLSDEYVVLFRAHHITTRVMDVQFNSFLRDYSDYPEINDLYIVSDMLITDYSSVMVDYAILERPILCLTSDMGQYLVDGYNALLVKDCDSKQLVETIRRALSTCLDQRMEMSNNAWKTAAEYFLCEKYLPVLKQLLS